MLFFSINDLKPYLIPEKRILGIDIGASKIGIALSDLNQFIASPYGKIIRKSFAKDIEAILKIINEYDIEILVIGYPLQFSGQESHACNQVQDFAKKVLKQKNIYIYFQDERFSTKIAKNVLKEFGYNRKKAAEKDDQIAAAYILQSFLDLI